MEETTPAGLAAIVKKRKGRPLGAKNKPRKPENIATPAETLQREIIPENFYHSFTLVAFPWFPEAETEERQRQIIEAMDVVSRSVLSIPTPRRFLGEQSFQKTGSNAKKMPISNSNSTFTVVLRDSYSDNLLNALDLLASNQKNYEFYGILKKKDRRDSICSANVFQNIGFQSITTKDGYSCEKNSNTNLLLTISITGWLEITTADVNNVEQYLQEKFKI